ncbi:hypothetical protein BDF21DRAFT_429993 [Thamnidium elegans]|nr:hypothetical protein BDF21DRAFT_429993 [Thamnidium elegans]
MTELSEADKKLQDELEKLSQQRQLILARLERSSLERINQNLEQAESSRKRPSSLRETSDQQVQSIKKSAKDSIVLSDIQGTLGERLLELGQTVLISDKRSKYLSYLCKNCVIDLTPSNEVSQIDLIGSSRIRPFLEKYLVEVDGDENSDNNIDELAKLLSKLSNKQKLESCYKDRIAKYEPRNDIERAVHNIYKYVLEQHAFRSFMLTNAYIDACSEQSINIKYWSYLFETYFGRNRNIFLQWGDTIAADCKNSSLSFKLDLRIIVNIEKTDHDIIAAELAPPTTTINSKLYNDKLKLALVSKCHLNSLLMAMPFIPKTKIKLIRLPLIQIMGLSCHIYALSLIDKGVYLLQRICSVTYPFTHIHLQTGGLQKIVQAFSVVEDMISDISDYHRNYSIDNSIKMDKLLKSTADVEDWVSEVIWEKRLADEN